jgi:iron-sulfur cluster assembly accessory protein
MKGYKDNAIPTPPVFRRYDMVTLTDSAIKAVHRFISGSDGSAQGLRIQVTGGGCSGFQYGLKLEPSATDEDTVIEYGDVKVFIDPASMPMISGATVDFVDSLEGSGFKFVNPNAKSACSCGSSFSC